MPKWYNKTMNTDKIQEAYAKKRQAENTAKEKAAQESKHRQSLGGSDAIQKAVLKAEEMTIKHREQVAVDAEKRLAEVTDAINKLNLTTFTASQPKIADMVENLKSLCEEMSELSDKFKEVGFKPVSDSMTKLIDKIDGMPSKLSDIVVKLEKSGQEEKLLRDLVSAVKALKLDPKITVDSPKITVPKVDLSGVEQAIRDSRPEEKESIEMSEYRAVVINDESENTQYVGFMKPSGEWHILFNNIIDNEFLYKFGRKDFYKSWRTCTELSYLPLNVAVEEVYGKITA